MRALGDKQMDRFVVFGFLGFFLGGKGERVGVFCGLFFVWLGFGFCLLFVVCLFVWGFFSSFC